MYKEKTNKELIELLEIYNKLTFQSQLNLKEELIKRNLNENIDELENVIQKKTSEIKNLNYLKDIGFEVEKIGDSIIVTRTIKAIVIDIIASVLGIIFCIIGLYGLFGLIGLFFSENELKFFGFIVQLGMIGLGILGINFLNGIKRLIDYSGFELLNTNDTIILKKRFDLKLVEIQKSTSLLNIEEQTNRLVLKLDNNEVLDGNSNSLIQNMTLNELSRKLKTNINGV